jgi:hypothetical protein
VNGCLYCQNRGVFLATLKNNGNDQMPGPFAFKCGCSYGRADIRAIPVWRPSDASQFVPEWEGVAKAPPIAPKATEATPRKPVIGPSTMPTTKPVFDDDDESDLF